MMIGSLERVNQSLLLNYKMYLFHIYLKRFSFYIKQQELKVLLLNSWEVEQDITHSLEEV